MKKIFLETTLLFPLLVSTANVYSESVPSGQSVSVPSMPLIKSVIAPSMPQVSDVQTPSVGSSFYAPKIDDFYKGATIKNSDNDLTEPKMSEKKSKETPSARSLLEKINSASSIVGSTYLTAGDLQNLDINGNFTNLSELLASNNLNYTAANNPIKNLSNPLISSSSNNQLLEKVLAELETLKKQQNLLMNSQNISPASYKNENSLLGREKDNARILRFFVNGYDVLSTCKEIYFSDKESDGTFLLTGDRQYTSNNRLRNETFYLLFKAVGNKSGVTEYKVAPDVNQDWENKLSFLYQLAKLGEKNNLIASQTGNLITLKIKKSDWNCDILIDAGSK